MRNRNRSICRLLCLTLAVVPAFGCVGCAEKKQETEKAVEEVSIPMILIVNSTTGKKSEEEVVEAFNEAYEGSWEVDVKWIMETEEEYRQNLKRLNVTDELPAVITDLRMLPSFYQLMIQDGRLEDLKPYLDADLEWQEMIEPVVMEACTEPEGEVYLAPISTAAFSCSGVFWNEELFLEAGITSFPKTWEEFWECCDTLKAHGITPLALHTEGTAWAPMLLATAELAGSPEGAAFLKEGYSKGYQNKNGIQMAETLKRLFTYTTEDALYSDFDVSYENFFAGRAAMLPNGYWMTDQIPQGWEEKTRFSAFPGNCLISSPETFGWSVISNYSDLVKTGAVEFLKFRTKMNQEKKEALFSRKREELPVAVADYIDAYQGNPQFVPNYQVKWNSILQEQTLGEALPQLVSGKISPAQFTRLEDESIEKSMKEQ